MKFIIVIFVSVLSTTALAFSTRFSCATDHLTTSYAMIEHDEYFELQAWHHNGLEFMPIHQGLITVTDLQTLKGDSQLLAPLGERYVLRFSKQQCRQVENDWSCFDPSLKAINALAINGAGLKAYAQTVSTRTLVSEQYAIELSLQLPGLNYTLPMIYSRHNCAHYPSPY